MVMDEEIDIGALKSYSAPDILICGNCRYVITFISRYNIFQFWEFNLIHLTSVQSHPTLSGLKFLKWPQPYEVPQKRSENPKKWRKKNSQKRISHDLFRGELVIKKAIDLYFNDILYD